MVTENVTVTRTFTVGGKLGFSAIAEVTRSPQVVISLIWLMLFVFVIWILKDLIIKLIEEILNNYPKTTKKWYYLIIITVFFIFLIALISFAIHYGPINLIKIIADWFGIEY